jgi:hypothetical protein
MDAHSALALAGWILFAAGCLAAAVGLGVLALRWIMQPLEEPADDMMAVAEAVRDPVDVLVEQFDWHAYEHEMSKR